MGVAQQTVRAVREGFGLGDGDKVFVKMFSSPLRGHTLASPTFEEVGEPDDVASGSWHDYRVKGASVERASERPTGKRRGRASGRGRSIPQVSRCHPAGRLVSVEA